jgi:hypothetical protein
LETIILSEKKKPISKVIYYLSLYIYIIIHIYVYIYIHIYRERESSKGSVGWGGRCNNKKIMTRGLEMINILCVLT